MPTIRRVKPARPKRPTPRPGRSRVGATRWVGRAVLLVTLAVAIGLVSAWLTLPDVEKLARTNPPTTAFIELRRDEASAAKRRFRLRWSWVPLQRISPYLRFAVVAAEDARFFDHGGIDWSAVKEAARRDLEERQLSSGGSTITQQLAKNLYLSPSKNPVRKLREAWIARRLEATIPKRRILEIYLNVVEWGDGVFGAEAAARAHFGHGALALTPAEAARLAVALPNPHRRSPRRRSAALARKAGRIVQAMRWRGHIDDAAYASARADLGLAPRPRSP